MIKHTIEISREAAHLSVQLGQLLLKSRDRLLASIPCEDIGVVVVDNPGTTYSHAALVALAEHGAVVVVCGQNHLPNAMVVPLGDHCQIAQRVARQIAATRPLCKRLWKQLVQAKIRAQARNLLAECPGRAKLLGLVRQVRAGDPTNIEAQAARIYWQYWIPEISFQRHGHPSGLNAMLNYGYAVLRAAVARALTSAGLLPALGLYHSHRANAFCLADDLLEPLRPLVDRRVRQLFRDGHADLTAQTKPSLLASLEEPVRIGRQRRPLMVSIHGMVASLVDCFERKSTRLEIPAPCS